MTTNEKLKEAEKELEALKKENADLNAGLRIYDNLPAAVFIYKMTGTGRRQSLHLCYANAYMIGITGLPAEETGHAPSDMLADIMHCDDRYKLCSALDHFSQTGTDDQFAGSFRFTNAMGKEIRLWWHCKVLARQCNGSPAGFLFCGIEPVLQQHDYAQWNQYCIEWHRRSNAEKLAALSRGDIECLILITRGLSSKEIAVQLNISPRGVDSRRESLYKKLQINNLALLIIFGHDNGFDQMALDRNEVKLKNKFVKQQG